MGDQPHYIGHRRRLRERFLGSGGEGMPDYELLELLLATAIPRRDVKPLAKDLLTHFGSFAEVLSADADRLMEMKGLGTSATFALKIVREAAIRLSKEQVMNRPVLASWTALIDYCRAAMAFEKREQFRILFLNRKNMLIADEVQQKGTINHTPVYPREVMKRALELSASAIILVHNHPSGDPSPSKEDIAMTEEVVEAGKKLGVTVHDHVVIGREGHASFKTMGLL